MRAIPLNRTDYCQFLTISQTNYSLTYYAEHARKCSHDVINRFLDNEVRVDALKVLIHKKTCQNANCKINKVESDLAFDIKDKIIKKAARLVKTDKEK